MKNTRLLALLCTAAASTTIAASAHAQFMDMLKNAVGNATAHAVASAAGNAAGKATTEALSGGGGKGQNNPQNNASSTPQSQPVSQPAAPVVTQAVSAPAATNARPGCPRTRATPLAPIGPRPDTYQPEILWPEEPACGAFRFADLKFDAARAQLRAFTDASAVPCNDCEGGKAYDAWARHHLPGGDYDNKFNQMLVALKPGETFKWKGARYSGTIALTGEHPIGEVPCKQFHWTLRDKANNIAAERAGLYCQWKGDYSASAKWQEVL